jgi:N-acetylmuramoyl-L-alanine amidase
MAKIVLDPGHGGTLPVGGSSANNATGPTGLKEKSVTLALAKLCNAELRRRGHSVTLTRSNDTNLGLAARAKVARSMQADAFVSIHFNGWDTPSVQGTETWLHSNHSPESEALAKAVQKSLIQATGLRNRGVKSKNLGVLRPNSHAVNTAACLAEVSFLTDPDEEARLRTTAYKKNVAAALADGVETYLNASPLVAEAELEDQDVDMLASAQDGTEAEEASLRNKEATLWKPQSPTVETALSFWHGFFGLRKGAQHSTPLAATDLVRLRQIIRAVSWVESKHGSAGANQPRRDPMQCGNPNDAWWKELTGQSGNGSRFIRETPPNYWARELAAAAANVGSFPSGAKISELTQNRKGHADPKFTKLHSYNWGIPYLLHRTNTKAGRRTYQCGDLSRSDLVRGAVEYNGGGDPNYEKKIEAALKLIGNIT